MSDAIWFYAKNDQQKGPVTPAQLKALAASGEVLPTDLVWKEGMDDWAPASEVKGLFAGIAKPPAAPEAASELATTKSVTPSTPSEPAPQPTIAKPSASPTTASAPTVSPAALGTTTTPVGSSSRWANPPPAPANGEPLAAPEPPPAVAATPTPTSATRSTTVSGSKSRPVASPAPIPQWVSPLLVVLGLFLVLTTRGCDALGNRSAARLVARYELSKARFEDDWSLKRRDLEAKRELAGASQDEGLIKQQAIEEAQNALTQLNADMAKEKARLERERWHDMSIAARDAAAENVAWSYWRQLVFLPASIILVAGLLGISLTREGPERWIALGTLLVIAYSLFVGGDAWK